MATPRLCSIPGCGKPHNSHGLCHSHGHRLARYGNPFGGGPSKGAAQNYFRDVVLKHESDDCLRWPFCYSSTGYGKVQHAGRMHRVSRLVCQMVNGQPPTPKHQAAHNCGNRACVNKRHLRWATRAENMADTLIHGTHLRGENHTMAKLTNAQADEIRAMEGTMLQREIATRFGVSRVCVHQILR